MCEDDLTAICDRLARHAVDDKKSTDNVSVCIVRIFPASQARNDSFESKSHLRPAGLANRFDNLNVTLSLLK